MRRFTSGPTGTGVSLIGVGAVAVVLTMLPVLVKLFSYPGYPGSDDAFIHMAVAENILNGAGWGITSNDRVNLSTSPMFTVLLLPVLSLGGIGLAQIFSAAFACLALAITFFVTRDFTRSNVGGIAALLVAASNVHLWRWSGTVMETTLAYLCVTVIAAAALQLLKTGANRPLWFAALGAVIGLSTMVRFEIALMLPLSATALAFAIRPGGRNIAALVGGFVAATLPWIAFATAYFGSPIPTTFFAKSGKFNLTNLSVVQSIGTVAATGAGVSILIAAVALGIAYRSVQGRVNLRNWASALIFLISWPVSLFVFYYASTRGLQSAGRYFLPGMATWPIAVGLIVCAVPGNRSRKWLTIALSGGLILGLVVNDLIVRPVLTAFNDGYRAAMTKGADFLQTNCEPGDTALIVVDIGILSHEGIGDCQLLDAGALATPALRDMPLAEVLERTRPTYLVESIGSSPSTFPGKFPQLKLVFSQGYPDHGIARYDEYDYLNIFKVTSAR